LSYLTLVLRSKVVKSKILQHYVWCGRRSYYCFGRFIGTCFRTLFQLGRPSLTPAPIAILSNHLSTRNREDADWLNSIVSGHSWVRRFAFDRIDDIPGILSKCADAGIGTLAIDGGDGTAGLVFSGLLNDSPYKTLPALALLPSGKTNMTAQAWSLNGNRQTALDHLIHKHKDGSLDGNIHSRAIITLDDGEATPSRHGAFFGGADVVEGILYCRRAVYPLGLPNVISHSAAVFILLWRALVAGQNTDALSVRFDGSDIGEEGRFFVVLVTTMDRMLLGVQPAPVNGKGPLHYISLRAGPGPVLSTIPSLVRRRISPSQARTVQRTNSVTLKSSGQYTLDGELYTMRPDQPLTLSSHQNMRFIRW
jgi:diacylglycerol kinase family enzyme